MQTFVKLTILVARCTFQDWRFRIIEYGEGYLLQVAGKSATRLPNMDGIWTGRKWYISPFATDSEVIQTAFLAVKTAMEHEVREQFLVDGVPIFTPHYKADRLVSKYYEIAGDARAPQPT